MNGDTVLLEKVSRWSVYQKKNSTGLPSNFDDLVISMFLSLYDPLVSDKIRSIRKYTEIYGK